MRVCIDIQSAAGRIAGVGRYTRLLTEHLIPLRGADELACFYFDFNRRGAPFPMPGVTPRVVRWCPGRYIQKAWRDLGWPSFDAFAGAADVYHFPNFMRYPLRRGRSVVTIHDLAFRRLPETCERKNLANLERQIPRTLEKVDHVITVSEFTAQELAELMNFPRERITAIPSGLLPPRRMPDETEIAATRRTIGLTRPYLLSLGTLEPRKNYPFLIDVFDALDTYDGDLVIAGMRGWKFEPILERLRASPKARRIRYLEYVDDTLLPGLYAGADAFIFPSLYEGFGFTPLEAMGYGTPVVSSAGGSLAEVLGDAALVLKEWDVDAWRTAISRLLGDTQRRRELVERAQRHIARYRWEDTAARTWAVYRQLAA